MKIILHSSGEEKLIDKYNLQHNYSGFSAPCYLSSINLLHVFTRLAPYILLEKTSPFLAVGSYSKILPFFVATLPEGMQEFLKRSQAGLQKYCPVLMLWSMHCDSNMRIAAYSVAASCTAKWLCQKA